MIIHCNVCFLIIFKLHQSNRKSLEYAKMECSEYNSLDLFCNPGKYILLDDIFLINSVTGINLQKLLVQLLILVFEC